MGVGGFIPRNVDLFILAVIALRELRKGITQSIHEAMVKEHCGEKLVGHNSRNSTAIVAREKPMKKIAERVNSYLKDNYGGRNIRVKGAAKVMTHSMFGIIAITANQLFRLLE